MITDFDDFCRVYVVVDDLCQKLARSGDDRGRSQRVVTAN